MDRGCIAKDCRPYTESRGQSLPRLVAIGQTFVGMALAASVANADQQFAGREVLRHGAVLWLAAEGEREVDKRIRAAVTALGCDPDKQPIYVQTAGVPKLLAQGGEAAVMKIVRQAERAARAEFGVPLVLVVFDTMIKSAGYKKSESDAVDVNAMIQAMDSISILAKCFVLTLDHMGKDVDKGARGSSDNALKAREDIPANTDIHIIGGLPDLPGTHITMPKLNGHETLGLLPPNDAPILPEQDPDTAPAIPPENDPPQAAP
jgi:AAA domain